MSELIVTGYEYKATDAKGREVEAGEEPATEVQNQTVGVAAVSFTAFNARTRFVRLHAEAACHISFTGTAAGEITKLAAGQTEFFGLPVGNILTLSMIQD